MALLTVDNLEVIYPKEGGGVVRAVDGVSFSIEAGEILALVGESGSGKSSVALALIRLLATPPAQVSGRVLFGGINLLEASAAQLCAVRGGKISYVFQEPASALNPVLSIGEQMLEMITLHTAARGAQAREAAVEWLKQVGIDQPVPRLSAYPHELSGGQQQRICFAMALCAKPSLLVADEPTTALDVTTQVQILRLIRDLQRKLNLSVLLISHDLTVVKRIAHRVGVMSNGRLLEIGQTSKILQNPAQEYSRQMIQAHTLLDFQNHPQ